MKNKNCHGNFCCTESKSGWPSTESNSSLLWWNENMLMHKYWSVSCLSFYLKADYILEEKKIKKCRSKRNMEI